MNAGISISHSFLHVLQRRTAGTSMISRVAPSQTVSLPTIAK